jgi:hypothetical protein
LCVRLGSPLFGLQRSIGKIRRSNMSQTSLWAGDVRAAIEHASHAIELNENFALGQFYLGIALSLDGRHE